MGPPLAAAPRVLIIRVLEACNAGCFMCDFRRSSDAYRYPESSLEHHLEQVAASSIRLVRFTGGEPLLHAGIHSIVRAFASRGLLTSLITNGHALQSHAPRLADAGLSQVVVSVDGVGAHHDRYRRLPGLFDAAVAGLRCIRRQHPPIRTRVNTVVGPHNHKQLCELYDVLADLGVEAWSLIPLKDEQGAWTHTNRSEAEAWHRRFLDHIGAEPRVRVLGHGLHWLGRDQRERDEFFTGQKVMTPRERCGLVREVRYFTPKDNQYYPCNCVPHRIGSLTVRQEWTDSALSAAGLGDVGAWLHRHGPTQCRGCEPVNAALGEGLIDLANDPFGY